MSDIIRQQDMYRLAYKTVYWPTGCDGSVVLLDGYDASKWLRYCYMVKFIWNGEIKQMKNGLCEYVCDITCHLNVYRRTYKTASRPTDWDGNVGHHDGYDAS